MGKLPQFLRLGSGLLVALALAACAQTTITLDRDGRLDGTDDGELEQISPYGFADRFGEPDIWRNEGETHGGLTMTQIWKCTDTRYREITWRMVQRPQGGMAWTIVNDINRKGECEPAQRPAEESPAPADDPDSPSGSASPDSDSPSDSSSPDADSASDSPSPDAD